MLKLSEGMNISRKAILITSAVILLIVVGTTGYFYWVNSKKSGAQSTLENSGNISEDISSSAAKGVLPSIQTNPLKINLMLIRPIRPILIRILKQIL